MIKIKQALIVSFCLVVMINITDAVRAEDAKISEGEAIVIALGALNISKDSKLTSVDLETVDGILVYAIEFTKDGIETDVKINAQTGEVVIIEDDLTEMGEEAADTLEEEENEIEDAMELETNAAEK